MNRAISHECHHDDLNHQCNEPRNVAGRSLHRNCDLVIVTAVARLVTLMIQVIVMTFV